MRLYYPSNYLEKYRYRKCVNDNKLLKPTISQNLCFEKYNINQIITSVNDKIDKKNYKCEPINSYAASRNIFNSQKMTYKYCKKITLPE